MHRRAPCRLPIFRLLIVLLAVCPATALTQDTAPRDRLQAISQYIADGWNSLERSTDRCASLVDPKQKGRSVLYLPADFSAPEALQNLPARCAVAVERLPFVIHRLGQPGVEHISPPGLLYLPHPYVVPGGRFNEMYGWDSYFIVLGLLRYRRLDLAEDMARNFFFEIDHYGAVLNANRTYYLTRSQPPLLSSLVMAIYEAKKPAGQDARSWLAESYPYLEKDHAFWTRPPHLAESIGLSRYFDFGEGPAPESVEGEPGYYHSVASYFLSHPRQADGYWQKGAPDSAFGLSAEYYRGDRAMRESGFDVSFRFGPYGAAAQHFAPVCLNTLLYKEEKDLEEISRLLGRDEEAARWGQLAAARAKKIRALLWEPARGMFYDYDLRRGGRSTYDYATAFYPLWAGLATPQQAAAVDANLRRFERPGGLAMSTRETGVQWDYPYGWAPIQLLAVEGLRRYGYQQDADRVAYEFLSTVLDNFERDGTIREKYNVATRSSETHVAAGYKANVVGFGWTNGVFAQLLSRLPEARVARLRQRPGVGPGKPPLSLPSTHAPALPPRPY